MSNRPTVWTVTTEFEEGEDAIALQELVAELGYSARVTSRQIEPAPRNPIRQTRLGRLLLRVMPDASRTFTIEDAQDWLVREDYKPQSASPALSMMVRDGDVDHIGTGLFRRTRP